MIVKFKKEADVKIVHYVLMYKINEQTKKVTVSLYIDDTSLNHLIPSEGDRKLFGERISSNWGYSCMIDGDDYHSYRKNSISISLNELDDDYVLQKEKEIDEYILNALYESEQEHNRLLKIFNELNYTEIQTEE